MTDRVGPPRPHTSVVAKARLARRYRRERRFGLIAFGAVMLAMSFLALLLSGIVMKGYSAFWQHYVTLDVTFDERIIDPPEVDPPEMGSQEAIFATDYRPLLNNALSAIFPDVKSRRARRERLALLSSGADLTLRDMVLNDPSLVGTSASVSVLLSDEADLFLKNAPSFPRTVGTRGRLRVLERDARVELTSSADDFAPVLADVRQQLEKRLFRRKDDIERGAKKLDRIENELSAHLESLERLPQGKDKTNLTSRITARRKSVEIMREKLLILRRQARELQERIAAGIGGEKLTVDMPGYFVRLNDVVVRLSEVSANMARGDIVQSDIVQSDSVQSLSSAREIQPGGWSILVEHIPRMEREITDRQLFWLHALSEGGRIEQRFNYRFFTAGASREAERAGIGGALVGSFYVLLVTFLLSFPLGIAAAIYLEEFAPRNRWTDLIEVNINNLAAVPSIVFGLLGLAVFLNIFGVPRSAPVAGGMVLALMTLPTIIIASRAALKTVPLSIREAALGLGASYTQVVFHHVVPLALPGILTGTIIGMAQALGETAPLLMIGMVAFIVDVAAGPFDPATVLPVQIYMWADFPEPAFQSKAAAAIMVLLGFLILMNALAFFLRRRFERSW